MNNHPLKSFILLLLSTLLIVTLGCVTVPKNKKKSSGPITAYLGQNIIQYAISIDAQHYTQLDTLLPKYKILTIAMTNQSLGTLRLDPLKDKWKVQDYRGRWHKAINSLEVHDPKSWNQIPEKMQKLIRYPITVPTGFTQTFDIFFPAKKVQLKDFRALRYYNAPLHQKFILNQS